MAEYTDHEQKVKVTLTFNSLDELLEHLNITEKTMTSVPKQTETENEHHTGCGYYIALLIGGLIATLIVGLCISIFVARIISY